MRRTPDEGRDRGASAVEYGLLVAGITVVFLVAAIGLQGVVGSVIGHAVTSVQQTGAPAVRPAVTATP